MYRESTSINIEGGLFLPVETPNLGISTKGVKHLIANNKTKRRNRLAGSPSAEETEGFRGERRETPQAAPEAAERDRQGSRSRAGRPQGCRSVQRKDYPAIKTDS